MLSLKKFVLFIPVVLFLIWALPMVVNAAKSNSSAAEEVYNPFGDPWSENTGPNPDIPTALTPGCYRTHPKTLETVPTDEEMTFLAKSNSGILFEDCVVLGAGSAKVKAISDAVHQKNPNIKYLGYHVFYFTSGGGLGNHYIDQNHEDWFVHKKGAPATKENRLLFNGVHNFYDISNPHFRAYMSNLIAQTLDAEGLDGFVVDGVTQSLPYGNPNEIPDHLRTNWNQYVVEYAHQVKTAMGPNKLFIFNADMGMYQFNSMVLPYVDGVMFEDPFGAVSFNFKATERFDRLNNMLNLIQSQNKYALMTVNTNANGTTFQTTNEALERAWERYYLAAFLNFFRSPKHVLVYYTPSSVSNHFTNEVFFKDWNLKLGQPLESFQEPAPRVFGRHFTNGAVYWNNSDSHFVIPGNEDQSLVTPEGVSVRNYVLAAKSGAIFMKPPPAPTPVPTPTPDPNQVHITQVNRVVYRPTGLRFWTMNQDEVRMLVSGGWTDEGRAYLAYSPYGLKPENAIPMYRLTDRSGGNWFWTINNDEVNLLLNHGWTNEGVAYYVHSPYNPQPANTEKVYRVYDRNAGKRFWTTNVDEVNYLVAHGLINEGVAFYTPVQ